jgi:predicted  nucleic acid-binding Zn-ribbon protein
MQEIFEKLQKLQEILTQKHAIEKRLANLPRDLVTQHELLTRIKKNHEEVATKHEQMSSELNQLRISLTDTQSSKQNLEQKMGAIKTQREFELLEKEINDASLEEERLRGESHNVQLELNEVASNLELSTKLITEQETTAHEMENRIKNESKNEERQLALLKEEETLLSQGLDSVLLENFEIIIRNKKDLGIVAVRGGICQGCHIVLPAQFVNKVRLGEGINFCPHCSRIIYFEEGGDAFSQVFFDEDEMAGLSDLIDEEDYEEEEEIPVIDNEMSEDYEDN